MEKNFLNELIKELEQLKNKEINLYNLEEKIDNSYNFFGSIFPYIDNLKENNYIKYEYSNYYNNNTLTLIYERIDKEKYNNILGSANIFDVKVILKDYYISTL